MRISQEIGTTGMMFTLDEMADILKVDPQRVRDWVREGAIEPADRGGKGRGQTHRFSVQQIIGFCLARDLLGSCSSDYFRDMVEEYSRWPWSAVEHCLGLRNDDWSGEALAKALRPQPQPPFELPEQEMTPERFKVIRRMYRSLLNIRRAVKERLDGRRGRVIEHGRDLRKAK